MKKGFKRRGRALVAGMISFLLFIDAAQAFKVFDDQKKVIIVTHDSINYLGELQAWISWYYKSQGKSNPFIFAEVSGRFSGMDRKDGKMVASWVTQFKDVIQTNKAMAGANAPVIVFCQSGMGVADLLDTTNTTIINEMNQEIKDMCDIIKGYGADLVYPSTLHYQWTHRRYAENEPVVVRAFNKKNYGYTAIDCVTPTVTRFPAGESGDKRHNNPEGTFTCAFEWFKELCRYDGVPVPAWAYDSLASIQKKWANYAQVGRYTGPVKGRYKVGDKIKVSWEGDCSKLDQEQAIRVRVNARAMDTLPHTEYDSFYGLKLDNDAVPACALGEYTWTVGEDWIKKATGGAPYGSYAVAVELTVMARHSHGNHDYTVMGSNPTTCGQLGANFNPDNVIVVYPSTTKIDESLPVWGFWGKGHTSTNLTLKPAAEPGRLMLGIYFESSDYAKLMDVQGRYVKRNSVSHAKKPLILLPNSK